VQPFATVKWSPERNEGLTVRPLLEQLEQFHAESYGWALACCAWRRELAEDVLQEAYLRVLDGRAKFSGSASSKTWFFAVIKRTALEGQRKQRRWGLLNLRIANTDIAGADTERSGPEARPELLLEADRGARELRAALMALPVRQREVLHLVFYSDCTLQEAAAALDISVGSARTHYHRGKVRLAHILYPGESDA
jgi:RNA polymerase sigma-70 factor (ECF subfamily)